MRSEFPLCLVNLIAGAEAKLDIPNLHIKIQVPCPGEGGGDSYFIYG